MDIVWNTSSPSFSNIIESLSIPHIESGFFLGTSKDLLREHMKGIGVSMPRVVSSKSAKEVFEKLSPPWRVDDKLVHTFPELVEAIKNSPNVLVEEFITGKVASTHSIPNFRGEDIYIFPVINTFGELSRSEKEKLDTLARDLHAHLGAKHYLKSIFLLNKRGKV